LFILITTNVFWIGGAKKKRSHVSCGGDRLCDAAVISHSEVRSLDP